MMRHGSGRVLPVRRRFLQHLQGLSVPQANQSSDAFKIQPRSFFSKASESVLSSHESKVVAHDEKYIRLMQQTSRLERNILLPMNEKLIGPLDRKHKEDKLPALPFVFCLGNHSSGKSTFINYLVQRDVQSTGVAPTDDGFTIIAPGQEDIDQDGPALVGDPDLGFAGLRTFGPALVQRTQLKVRKDIHVNFMLVDSPGMIDSPKSVHAIANSTYYASGKSYFNQSAATHDPFHRSGTAAAAPGRYPPGLVQQPVDYTSNDRGYEFPQVIRWYAERADVILLFFDPDKPGTTGETLSILTSALIGMDHKLQIVLNKVDQFRKIHDFARAYGSLCWNLSKVIPLKDLPRIYTMCIPVKNGHVDRDHQHSTQDGSTASASATAATDSDKGLSASIKDLDAMREEVVHEVMRAPERRVDNLITNLYDSTRMLQMHARMFDDLRTSFVKEKYRRMLLVAGVFGGGNALALASFLAGLPLLQTSLVVSLTTLLASVGLLYNNHQVMSQLGKALVTESHLNERFRVLYGRQLAEGDEYVVAIWKRVRSSVQLSMETLGLDALPSVSSHELESLERILAEDIPALRRQCAPAESSLAHQVAQLFRRPGGY